MRPSSIIRSANLHRGLALGVILGLGGCGTMAPVEEKDGGPAYSMDTSHIPDVVPRDEPRSRYGNPSSYEVNGRRYYVMESAQGYREQGNASWYGNKFHGRRTSSGEPYDMYKLTAAHTRLPIPSYVRVTNLANGRSVVVRVNDRGPFHEGRIIDLSYAAASRLGIVETGTARVEVVAVSSGEQQNPTPPQAPSATTPVAAAAGTSPALRPGTPPGDIFVQVGAFISRTNAERLRNQLFSMQLGSASIQEARSADATVYRVRLGPYSNAGAADAMAARLLSLGVGTPRIVTD